MVRPSEQPPEWLSVTDISTRMRVSKMTVYRMIRTGELPAIQFGGRCFRVNAEWFDSYVAKLSEVGAAEDSAAVNQ